MSTADTRLAAEARVRDLLVLVKSQPDSATRLALAEECEALERAIRAFHMEAIRFRMYNVDRLLASGAGIPAEGRAILEEARRHLEAAGFHTRSHQAPT
jgi:hypothetical protein